MEAGLISVDRWSEGSQAYFLTHLHADHTHGLTSSWCRGPLVCSRLTAKLLPLKFPGFNLSLLRVLELGHWYSLSLSSPSSGSVTTLQVMPIDAHHCPGAVMFLFRGEYGTRLYTGDFRWETTCERTKASRTMLLDALNSDGVDLLYLDNTYCNPSYAFPSRKVAAQQVVDIIASHPNHDIIIGIDTVGKEDLLLHISSMLKVKIWVWPERLQTMHLLGFENVFTTNTSLTRIRAVPRYSFSIDTLEGLNRIRPTIGIMPSGLPWALKPVEQNESLFVSTPISSHDGIECLLKGINPRSCHTSNAGSFRKLHEYIYAVPYSDHSCYEEIKEFINLVCPANIRGIVSSSSCYIDPLYYFSCSEGVSQPSKMLKQKHRDTEKVESVVAMKTKSSFQKIGCAVSGRRRRGLANISILGISRVSALRRLHRGAKIFDTQCTDRLD